jgi:hypothetical protein
MSSLHKPFFADADQLLLSGHLLMAMEVGRMRMDAADYFEIATWTAEVVERLESEALLRLRKNGLHALHVVAENALNDRGEIDWAGDQKIRSKADKVWRQLSKRLSSSRA